MTENEKKVNDQHSDDDERGNKQDYNKMVGQQPAGTTAGDAIASSRDLGSIGGGSLPWTSNSGLGIGKYPGGMNNTNGPRDNGSTIGKSIACGEHNSWHRREQIKDHAAGGGS